MVWFLGHFCIHFFTDKDYYIITNIKVNFGDLYTLHKTVYKALSYHNHIII